MSIVSVIRARVHAGELDAALIAGVPPDSSPELEARGRRLTSRGFRAVLANGLENAVRFPDASRYARRAATSAAVAPPAGLALLAGPSVRRLAADVRAATDPDPRAIALVVQFLTDPASPLFRGPSLDEMLEAIALIEEALRC